MVEENVDPRVGLNEVANAVCVVGGRARKKILKSAKGADGAVADKVDTEGRGEEGELDFAIGMRGEERLAKHDFWEERVGVAFRHGPASVKYARGDEREERFGSE